jgi:hypothetical protein
MTEETEHGTTESKAVDQKQACSPLRGKALIHRDQYPQHYMGTNPQGFPCWTSYPLNAMAYDAADVHDMLNWLVKWEPSVKAVIYPAAQVARPDWANTDYPHQKCDLQG